MKNNENFFTPHGDYKILLNIKETMDEIARRHNEVGQRGISTPEEDNSYELLPRIIENLRDISPYFKTIAIENHLHPFDKNAEIINEGLDILYDNEELIEESRSLGTDEGYINRSCRDKTRRLNNELAQNGVYSAVLVTKKNSYKMYAAASPHSILISQLQVDKIIPEEEKPDMKIDVGYFVRIGNRAVYFSSIPQNIITDAMPRQINGELIMADTVTFVDLNRIDKRNRTSRNAKYNKPANMDIAISSDTKNRSRQNRILTTIRAVSIKELLEYYQYVWDRTHTM